jgi:hypothetical protein
LAESSGPCFGNVRGGLVVVDVRLKGKSMILIVVRLVLGVLLIGGGVLIAGAIFHEGELSFLNWVKGLASMMKYLVAALVVMPLAAVACVVLGTWMLVCLVVLVLGGMDSLERLDTWGKRQLDRLLELVLKFNRLFEWH